MIQKLYKTFFFLVFLGAVSPVFALHGSPDSGSRDGWIDQDLQALIDAGLVRSPSKPLRDLTNRDVARLTAKAGEIILAQADLGGLPPLPGDQLPGPGLPPPPETSGFPASNPTTKALKSVHELVEEYKGEMAALGEDIPFLEERIFELERENEHLADLQRVYLTRTGADVSGYARSYLGSFRGFGLNQFYPAEIYDSIWTMEMRLKSVPVPFVLFDVRLRLAEAIGAPSYAIPIVSSLQTDFRWISLTSFNEFASVTAGDFFKHYTPLTLWNPEIPVFTFIEPTPYRILRKDAEEWNFLDHGPDYRLRGVQASTALAWPADPLFSFFQTQIMAGPVSQAIASGFSDYFAGSQASLSFFNDNLELKGTGLLFWNDLNSSSGAMAAVKAGSPATWPRQYQVGSVSARAAIPFAENANLAGTWEYAGNNYNDDLTNTSPYQKVFQDWAAMGTGSVNVSGVHLNVKYLNVGPWFYSPGAQTNRFTPFVNNAALTLTYNSNNGGGLDENIIGDLNRFVFQRAGTPFYATYDRMTENMLPYGDATPNREAIILGFSAELGENGWIRPQGSYVLSAKETQPNYVLNKTGDGAIPIESLSATMNARTFAGYEGALTVDLAKLWVLKDKVYQASVDYKHQSTDLGLGDPFAVNTITASADFNVPFDDFDQVVLCGGYEQAQSSGSEYVLSWSGAVKGLGTPPVLGQYLFYGDTPTSTTPYAYTNINLTRSSWAAGLKFPINKYLVLRGVWVQSQYTGSLVGYNSAPISIQGYDRQDQIWRFELEAGF